MLAVRRRGLGGIGKVLEGSDGEVNLCLLNELVMMCREIGYELGAGRVAGNVYK